MSPLIICALPISFALATLRSSNLSSCFGNVILKSWSSDQAPTRTSISAPPPQALGMRSTADSGQSKLSAATSDCCMVGPSACTHHDGTRGSPRTESRFDVEIRVTPSSSHLGLSTHTRFVSDGLMILQEGVGLYSPSIIVRRERANLCDRLWWRRGFLCRFWGKSEQRVTESDLRRTGPG